MKKHPKGTWITGASLPTKREGHTGGQIGNFIYVSHGFLSLAGGDSTSTIAYDINNNVWVPKQAAFQRRSELAGVTHGDKLYAIGGRYGTVLKTLEVYDAVSDTWAIKAQMPTARAGLGAAVVGDTIYAIGGRTGTLPKSGTPLDVVESYNIAQDTWTTGLAKMPTPRMDIYSTVAHGGKIYVIGGYNHTDGDLTIVEVYDPSQDTWSTVASMSTARSNLTATVKGNTIYAIGGVTGNTKLITVEAYDIDKNVWSTVPSMTTASAELISVCHGDLIFVMGGGFLGVAQEDNQIFRPY